MKHRPRLYVHAPLLAALCSATTPVSAESQMMLEEVLVTAEKKAKSLQDTPISISAFSEDTLDRKGISGINDLTAEVPSMVIEPFPTNNATLRIYIRGIGVSDAQITQDPAVGIYQDGAYIARSSGLAMDIADLQRIEVLRGPQGTLYGRNSTGGTINLITRRPTADAFEFQQDFTLGNRDQFKTRSSVNVPLTDTAALKLAYLNAEKGGFIENTGEGGDFGDRETEGVRLDFRWLASETLTLDYSYEKNRLQTYTYTFQAITPKAQRSGTDPDTIIANQLASESDAFIDHTGSDRRASSLYSPTPLLPTDTDIEGHALTLSWALDAGEIKYIGAYREMTDTSYVDLSTGSTSGEYRIDTNAFSSKDGSVSYPAVRTTMLQDQSSHELQFVGDIPDTRLSLIAGVYYFEEEASEDTPLHHQFNSPLSTTTAGGVTTRTSLFAANEQSYTIDNSAWAIYSRLTWNPDWFDNRWNITLGARHSEDKRYAEKYRYDESFVDQDVNGIAGPPVPLSSSQFAAEGDRKFRDDSFELINEFALGDVGNTYFKLVEAYKSGGYNIREPEQDRFSQGYAEEKVASAELGLKLELLNRRLRINTDVFVSHYTDMQMNFLVPGTISDTHVVNAGEAEMLGFEIDGSWLVLEDMVLTYSYAYLDADITKVIDPATGNDISSAYTFPSAPKHSGALAIDYTPARWDWGELGLNLSVNYMGERDGTADTVSIPRTRIDAFHLWGARIGLYQMAALGGFIDLSLWGKNLTDEEYVVNAIDNLPQTDRAVLWG